jgi:hypothetical protein
MSNPVKPGFLNERIKNYCCFRIVSSPIMARAPQTMIGTAPDFWVGCAAGDNPAETVLVAPAFTCVVAE